MAEDMPKPLGVPLGATVEQAQAAHTDNPMTEAGIGRFTNGPIFTASGAGLKVENLQRVVLVFDQERRPAALTVTLGASGFGKPGYDRVLGYLRSQYPLKSNENPTVGNKLATFETKGARIELDSPHMALTVTYMTKAFHQTFVQVMNAEKKAKAQSESSRF